MKIPALLLAILLFAFPVPVTSGATSVETRLLSASKSIAPDVKEATSEIFDASSDQLVIVVGENHASVRGQQTLAALIPKLRAQQLLDAILVEGSEGPLRPERTREMFLSEGVDETFLRRQLDAGRLAGYTYAAILDNTLPVHGVESMRAKVTYEAGSVPKSILDLGDSARRGLAVLESVYAHVAPTLAEGEGKGLASDLAAYRILVEKFDSFCKASATGSQPGVQKQIDAMMAQQELIAAMYRIKTSPDYSESAFKEREMRELYVSLKSIVDQIQRGVKISKDSVTPEQLTGLNRLEALMADVDAYRERHATEFKTIEATLKRRDELLAAAAKDFDKFADNRKQLSEVKDMYKLIANALCDVAGKHGVAASEAMSFFADDEKRREDEQVSNGPVELVERDVAMAQGVSGYISANNPKTVLLIVGYAHLPGIKRELSKQKINYIAGKLTGATEPIEPWETVAWSYRRNPAGYWLAMDQLKEVSEFLNDAWQQQQVKLVRFFRNTLPTGKEDLAVDGLANDGKIYRHINSAETGADAHVLSIHVQSTPFDPNAEYGDHVIDRGPAPQTADGYYQVIDQKIASDEVKSLSGGNVNVVFNFKAKKNFERQPRNRFVTREGEKSYGDFLAYLERSQSTDAKWTLLFGEPDDVNEGGYVSSPLKRQLVAENGGGGHNRPPVKTSTASPDEVPRSRVVHTINAARGKQNLVALDAQKTEFISAPLFLEEADLPHLSEKLRFTPSRGDHSQMLVLIAHNSAEFRAQVRKMGRAELLQGKQVVLVTCGDAAAETSALREELLREGTLMVWCVDRQITPSAAAKLVQHVRAVATEVPSTERATIYDLMDRALKRWRAVSPDDSDLSGFNGAAAYVEDEVRFSLNFPPQTEA